MQLKDQMEIIVVFDNHPEKPCLGVYDLVKLNPVESATEISPKLEILHEVSSVVVLCRE